MIEESLLQEAICRNFAELFPDLAAGGFRIKSREAVLLGRRLDIILTRPSDQVVIIIELKRGSPPMPDVRDQVLDYKQCWQCSFPGDPPRLIVVANSIPSRTEDELRNFGIETRAIPESLVLEVLKRSVSCDVVKGLHLIADDTARVRHLLSNYDVVRMPEGLLLAGPWNHEKVFLALVQRGEKHKDLWKKDIYVQLCPQHRNCAVLYGPKVSRYAPAFLHLNPRASSWRSGIFEPIATSLKYHGCDSKGIGNEKQNFDHYEVRDWDSFASGLGLPA